MRTILAVLLSGALAVSAVAKDRGLGMYLKGQDCLELSNPDLLHYVAGLVDAWLLEAFLTDGERFGWLMECVSNGPAQPCSSTPPSNPAVKNVSLSLIPQYNREG